MAEPSIEAVNAERRRMVKNLHDGLCQQLMGATMLSHVIMARMSKEDNSCIREMTQLDKYLQQAVEDMAALYKTLEPALQDVAE